MIEGNPDLCEMRGRVPYRGRHSEPLASGMNATRRWIAVGPRLSWPISPALADPYAEVYSAGSRPGRLPVTARPLRFGVSGFEAASASANVISLYLPVVVTAFLIVVVEMTEVVGAGLCPERRAHLRATGGDGADRRYHSGRTRRGRVLGRARRVPERVSPLGLGTGPRRVRRVPVPEHSTDVSSPPVRALGEPCRHGPWSALCGRVPGRGRRVDRGGDRPDRSRGRGVRDLGVGGRDPRGGPARGPRGDPARARASDQGPGP